MSKRGLPLTIRPGLVLAQVNTVETRYLVREIFDEHCYSEGVVLELRPGAQVVDVGANIGVFARYVLEQEGSSHVICIEPAPASLAALRENVGSYPNISVVDCAAGSEEGFAELDFYPNYTMMSTLHPDVPSASELISHYTRNVTSGWEPQQQQEFLASLPSILERRLLAQVIPVRVRRLSSILDEYTTSPRIDFLKIDVEGSEVEVLEGLDHWWGRVERLATEVQGKRPLTVVLEMLRSNDFEPVIRQQADYTGTELYMVTASHQ